MKSIPWFLCAVLLAGCASQTPLDRKTTFTAADAAVQDKRTEEQKAQRRDSNFSPISLLADDRFAPRAVDVFVDELVLQSKGTQASRPLSVEIDQFRAVDFFPRRLGSGVSGLLGSMLMRSLMENNTDGAFVDDAGVPRDVDSVICLFVGRINGTPVKVAASEPYKISPFAGLVVNDPDFRRALDVAVKRAASRALTQLPK